MDFCPHLPTTKSCNYGAIWRRSPDALGTERCDYCHVFEYSARENGIFAIATMSGTGAARTCIDQTAERAEESVLSNIQTEWTQEQAITGSTTNCRRATGTDAISLANVHCRSAKATPTNATTETAA